jgi:hypothetical protein
MVDVYRRFAGMYCPPYSQSKSKPSKQPARSKYQAASGKPGSDISKKRFPKRTSWRREKKGGSYLQKWRYGRRGEKTESSGLLFGTEDSGSRFLRNVVKLLLHYMASQHSR